MDQAHMHTLWRIFDKALNHAEECTEDESSHSAHEWMEVAHHADCIIHRYDEEEYDRATQQVRAR